MTAAGLDEQPEKMKVAILLNNLGAEGRRKALALAGPKAILEEIVDQINCHFKSIRTITWHRHLLFTRKQRYYETVQEFGIALQQLAAIASLREMEDKLIRDLFVTGLTNQKAEEQLLATQTKTFEEAREIAQRLEAAVKLSSPIIQLKERLGLLRYVPQYKEREDHNKGGLCRECGKEHLGTQKRCLARNRNFIKCGLKGHFASQCPKADQKYQPSPGRRTE